MVQKKAYLASPFFNQGELEVYHKVIDYLRNYENLDLYVPMEHTIEGAWDMNNNEWALKVFMEDVRAIDEADVVYVVNHGMYSDSGTAWECGYAYAKGKEVYLIIPVIKGEESSLMMVNGCTDVLAMEYHFAPLNVAMIKQK